MMREWILGASFLAGVLWPVPTWAQSAEEQIAGCVACHGEDGRPNAPEVPVIFGQQEGYLYFQLRDFKSGARKSEVMNGIAAGLTKDTMKALAAYFATKTWPRLPQAATAGAGGGCRQDRQLGHVHLLPYGGLPRGEHRAPLGGPATSLP